LIDTLLYSPMPPVEVLGRELDNLRSGMRALFIVQVKEYGLLDGILIS